MKETPETDAVWQWFRGDMELLQDAIDLSRKLERERDEAREKATKAWEENLRLDSQNCRLERQRDEARDMASAFAHFIKNPPYGVDQAVSKMLLLERWDMMREEKKKC